MISIKNLTKTYKSKDSCITALHDINLEISDGEIFGIIGLSGAGKSTLIRCINLLERPDAGQVFIDGTEITALSEKMLRKERQNIGMIFQNFNLLEQRTVISNVCFPLEIAGVKKKDAIKRAEELLELVGIADKAKSYPSRLSGGQKQRVAIARALATNPKYLLCDEATSALDPNTTASILDLIKSINKQFGVTVVIITHEMSVIERVCDRVAVIDNSQIIECGRVENVFANPTSKTAKELILPSKSKSNIPSGQVGLRLVFNGETYSIPVLSGLVRECGLEANVLFADVKELNGLKYGHMLLTFANNEEREIAEKWLNDHKIHYVQEVANV